MARFNENWNVFLGRGSKQAAEKRWGVLNVVRVRVPVPGPTARRKKSPGWLSSWSPAYGTKKRSHQYPGRKY